MRSDNLLKHIKTHKDLLSLPDEEIKEELRVRRAVEMERTAKRQRIQEIAHQEGLSFPQELAQPIEFDKKDVRERLLKNNQLYLNKIVLGEKIADIIEEGIVREESLTKEDKEALDLYRKQKPRFDIADIQLRAWQEDALRLIETPSEREVVWITGRQGNEGKSWFQSYMETYFGFHRVIRVDLRIKHASMCNVLKKRTLNSIDIFVFNDARSVTGEELNLYRILEDIKDGQATASKYDNDNIRFKTPNTVLIFSNQYPQTQKLSRDRWKIYNANQNGLNDVTVSVLKMRRDGYDNRNKKHLKTYNL